MAFELSEEFLGFHRDPEYPNRVWFMSRERAKLVQEFFGAAPTGETLVLPPQTMHLDVCDKNLQVTENG